MDLTFVLNKVHTLFLSRKKGVFIPSTSSVFFRSSTICKPISYKNGGKIIIGNNIRIGRSPKGYHGGMPFPSSLLADGSGASIVLGDNCRINGAYIHAEESITIGNNCVIASGVNIIDSNGHEVSSLDRTNSRDIPKGISIGNNVWIGLNATVLKGTIIGDNSVIGAGVVVKGHISANSLVSNLTPETKSIQF